MAGQSGEHDAATSTGGRAAAFIVRQLAASLGELRAPFSVAFSGGVDSTVLLEAARRLVGERGLPAVRALHVNHRLEPEAASWTEHCRRWCETRAVTFHALTVDARPGPGQSPEEAAREARYAALGAALGPGESLCVAHHADDQAETVLLNLLRGCGVRGTGAMAPVRGLASGRLLRPLLNVRRTDIEACARHWALEWLEDPANQRQHHPRNRLRHQLMPLIEEMSPGAVRNLVRGAGLHREAAQMLDDLAGRDLSKCRDGPGLSRRALAALPAGRRRAVLRRWVAGAGVRPLPRARLEELDRQLMQAARDRAPRLDLGAVELRVHADRVLLFASSNTLDSGVGAWPWRPGQVLELPGGQLSAQPAAGTGLSHGEGLEVRLRTGGERCRPAGRRHSQTLKRLLQAHAVPPWARGHLPLVYRDGALVAVADLFVCHGHETGPDEVGWQLLWRPRDLPLQPGQRDGAPTS